MQKGPPHIYVIRMQEYFLKWEFAPPGGTKKLSGSWTNTPVTYFCPLIVQMSYIFFISTLESSWNPAHLGLD